MPGRMARLATAAVLIQNLLLPLLQLLLLLLAILPLVLMKKTGMRLLAAAFRSIALQL